MLPVRFYLQTHSTLTKKRNFLLFASKGITSKLNTFVKNYCKKSELCNIPNTITLGRIIASPILATAVYLDMKSVALGGCVIFAITDWLDGYIAKKFNQKTVLGAYLDPLADKFMIGSLSIGLCLKGLIPLPLAALILSRDALLISAAFILRAIEKPKDAEFFDTTTATFNIEPSDISKINTAFQFSLLGFSLSNFAFSFPSIEYIEPLWWLTTTTTIYSGLSYIDGSGIQKIKTKIRSMSRL